MSDQIRPTPLDYRSPSPGPSRPPIWPNARFGNLSLACFLLAAVTFFGMIFVEMLMPSLRPPPTVYIRLLFFVPALLALTGSAAGLSGIVLDRRKMLAIFGGVLNTAVFFALIEIYPFAFMDH